LCDKKRGKKKKKKKKQKKGEKDAEKEETEETEKEETEETEKEKEEKEEEETEKEEKEEEKAGEGGTESKEKKAKPQHRKEGEEGHVLEHKVAHYVLKRLLLNLKPNGSEFASLLLQHIKDQLVPIAATNRGAFVLRAILENVKGVELESSLRILKPALQKYNGLEKEIQSQDAPPRKKKSGKRKRKVSNGSEMGGLQRTKNSLAPGIKVLMDFVETNR